MVSTTRVVSETLYATSALSCMPKTSGCSSIGSPRVYSIIAARSPSGGENMGSYGSGEGRGEHGNAEQNHDGEHGHSTRGVLDGLHNDLADPPSVLGERSTRCGMGTSEDGGRQAG